VDYVTVHDGLQCFSSVGWDLQKSFASAEISESLQSVVDAALTEHWSWIHYRWCWLWKYVSSHLLCPPVPLFFLADVPFVVLVLVLPGNNYQYTEQEQTLRGNQPRLPPRIKDTCKPGNTTMTSPMHTKNTPRKLQYLTGLWIDTSLPINGVYLELFVSMIQ
jgi:hypothetical protein